mmetsp:Transcript_60236/g.156530  ORF Transcript_60236/g.156530 Transcript_60236/m.156530 type:complete len:241 (-) Transcript_60236:169-891(-)
MSLAAKLKCTQFRRILPEPSNSQREWSCHWTCWPRGNIGRNCSDCVPEASKQSLTFATGSWARSCKLRQRSGKHRTALAQNQATCCGPLTDSEMSGHISSTSLDSSLAYARYKLSASPLFAKSKTLLSSSTRLMHKGFSSEKNFGAESSQVARLLQVEDRMLSSPPHVLQAELPGDSSMPSTWVALSEQHSRGACVRARFGGEPFVICCCCRCRGCCSGCCKGGCSSTCWCMEFGSHCCD